MPVLVCASLQETIAWKQDTLPMTEFKTINETMLAAGQIEPDDVALAKEAGVTLIINNRPDGEAPGQPEGDAIRAAAQEHGIAYTAIPVSSAGFSLPQVDAMQDALAKAEGKVLAFCRSGTRSTLLWSMAQAKSGADIETITAQAAAAGYDVRSVRPTMEMLRPDNGA